MAPRAAQDEAYYAEDSFGGVQATGRVYTGPFLGFAFLATIGSFMMSSVVKRSPNLQFRWLQRRVGAQVWLVCRCALCVCGGWQVGGLCCAQPIIMWLLCSTRLAGWFGVRCVLRAAALCFLGRHVRLLACLATGMRSRHMLLPARSFKSTRNAHCHSL